jgi:hypothetical protein
MIDRTLGRGMHKSGFFLSVALVPASASVGDATAQYATPTARGPAAPAAAEKTTIDVLKGAWFRPDGGYTIAIRSVDANGQLDAMYFNPKQLPFAKAQASKEGEILRVSFGLRAGGYDGSTYELTDDPTTDRLNGVYYQAVAKQKFEIYFVRKRAE